MPPTTTTTPILGSPRAPSTPSPAGAIKDAVLPTSTGAHTPRRNGRTQDVSHLLGFTLTPRVPPPAATPRRSARKATSSWFDKQRFVHQYRFVVKPDKLYLSQLADPDLYHAWEDVLQVIVPTSSALSTASTSTIDQPVGRDQEGGAVPTCPICLSEPTAARMSKCGHVYCYPCLLHYLALADGTKWRKCPVCYDSIYAKDLKSVKWHDPLAATAFSSLSLLPTDLYSHPTSFYTDAHLPTEPLKMRLIRRPQLSTLALPRSSTWPSEAVPPLRAPWQFTPDAMAFAKFMLGAPDYMKAELEGDLKELEAEVATLQRWGMKGGTDEEIGVVFVKAAMEKVKEQLEKVVEMKTHSVMTARKQALRELQAVEDAVGKHLLAPELPLFSETSSSEVEEDVPTEFLASRSAGGGSIGALSSSAAPFTPGGTTGLPTPPTTINKARPQRKNVNPPTSDADVTYLFYQAASGQNIFLQPLDIRILKSHFGSYEALPDTIEVLVEGSDEGSMNEELRRRCRWISHLPTSADVVFIEADLSRLVSKDVLEPFNVALKQRRTKRRDKSRREDKAKLKSEEKEVNDRPYYDLLQGSGGHSSYQFSSIPSAFSLATSSAHAFPPPSNDPTPTVRTSVYVDQSSASESTRTVWGTRSIASSQPIYEPEETEYDERWADFEDNIAVGYGNGTRRRGVGAGGGSTGSNSQGTRDRDRDVVGMPAGHAQGKGKKKKKIVLSLTGAGGRGTA